MRDRRRTMNSFNDNFVRTSRLDSNGSIEQHRLRSHSLCECFPNQERSQTGSSCHISWRCVHAVPSTSNFIRTKTGILPMPRMLEAYDLITLNNYNHNNNINLNQNQNNNDGCRRAGRGYLRKKAMGEGDWRRPPNRARRCPGVYDVRVSVLGTA